MEANQLIEAFPDVVVAIAELGTTLVTSCHDSDFQQMQSKVKILLAEGLVGAPFISNSDGSTEVQESFVQNGILLVMAQIHDPDKEIMLSHLHRLSEIEPEEAMKLAREQDKSNTISEITQPPVRV